MFIPDPRSRAQNSTGSRFRNTATFTDVNRERLEENEAENQYTREMENTSRGPIFGDFATIQYPHRGVDAGRLSCKTTA